MPASNWGPGMDGRDDKTKQPAHATSRLRQAAGVARSGLARAVAIGAWIGFVIGLSGGAAVALAQTDAARAAGGVAGPAIDATTASPSAREDSKPDGVTAARPPLAAYAALPRLSDVSLSPDGKRIAGLVSQGDDTLLVVRDVEGDEAFTAVLKTDNVTFRFRWVAWANDERLLASVIFASRRDFVGTNETRLLSIKADGKDLVNLVHTSAFDSGSRPAQVQDRIVDNLPADDRHVLLQMVPERSRNPAVYEVDVTTGQRRMVHPPQRDVHTWMTDASHRVRVGLRQRDEDVAVLVADPDGRQWREVWAFKVLSADGVWPMGFGTDPQTLYVRALHQGRWAVFEADLNQTPPTLSLKLAHPTYDIDGHLLRSARTGAAVGVRSTIEAIDRIDYWDASLRALGLALDKALPDQHNVITDFSADEQRYVLHAEGNGRPARYFVGDRRSHELTLLGGTYPLLEGVPLVGKSTLTLRARDGVALRAFLTVPGTPHGPKALASAAGRKLPLVMLPHGGPHGRDDHLFDAWTEFLASRGYAVLQVNFRGSSGYGLAFSGAGLQRWGLEMQDDLSDALDWAVKEGVADPARVCIVGASYGGYAALMGAVKTPGAFRCAVSFAGVSDLMALWHHQTDYVNGRAMADLTIGNAWRDRERFEATSPARQAARIQVPVLLVHGTADRIVPAEQSKLMDKALRDAGKTVRYVELEGGDHHLSRQSHRLRFFEELEGFLALHLGEPRDPR